MYQLQFRNFLCSMIGDEIKSRRELRSFLASDRTGNFVELRGDI